MDIKPTPFQQYLIIFAITLLGALPFVVNDTILLDDILHYNDLGGWVFLWTIQIGRPMHALSSMLFGSFANFSPTSTVLVALAICYFGYQLAIRFLDRPVERIAVALLFTTSPLFIDHWQYGVNHMPLFVAFLALGFGVKLYDARASQLWGNWRPLICFLIAILTKQDFFLFSAVLIAVFTLQPVFLGEKIPMRRNLFRAMLEVVLLAVVYFILTKLLILIVQPDLPMPEEYRTDITLGFDVLAERLSRLFQFATVYLVQAQAHFPIGLKILNGVLLFLTLLYIAQSRGLKIGLLAVALVASILFVSLSIGLLREFDSTYRYTGLGALMLFTPVALIIALTAGRLQDQSQLWLILVGLMVFANTIEIAKAGSKAATETKRNFGLVSQIAAEAGLHSHPEREIFIIDNCEAIDKVPNRPGWNILVETPQVWQTSMLEKGGLWCQSGLSKWLYTLTAPTDMDRIFTEELTIPLKSPTELSDTQQQLIEETNGQDQLAPGLHQLNESFFVFKLP